MRFTITAAWAIGLVLGLGACGSQSQEAEPAASQASMAAASSAVSQTASEASAAASVATASEPHTQQTQTDGPIASFTAFGSQPAWRAVLRGKAEDSGNRLSLEGEKLPTTELDTERSAFAKGADFIGNVGDAAVNLNIRTQDCTDSEGNQYELTATLDYGDKTYKGCAVAGAVEQAPT